MMVAYVCVCVSPFRCACMRVSVCACGSFIVCVRLYICLFVVCVCARARACLLVRIATGVLAAWALAGLGGLSAALAVACAKSAISAASCLPCMAGRWAYSATGLSAYPQVPFLGRCRPRCRQRSSRRSQRCCRGRHRLRTQASHEDAAAAAARGGLRTSLRMQTVLPLSPMACRQARSSGTQWVACGYQAVDRPGDRSGRSLTKHARIYVRRSFAIARNTDRTRAVKSCTRLCKVVGYSRCSRICEGLSCSVPLSCESVVNSPSVLNCGMSPSCSAPCSLQMPSVLSVVCENAKHSPRPRRSHAAAQR